MKQEIFKEERKLLTKEEIREIYLEVFNPFRFESRIPNKLDEECINFDINKYAYLDEYDILHIVSKYKYAKKYKSNKSKIIDTFYPSYCGFPVVKINNQYYHILCYSPLKMKYNRNDVQDIEIFENGKIKKEFKDICNLYMSCIK